MPASSPPPRSKSRSSLRRILLALVLIALATAAGLEFGARIIGRLRGKPFDAEVLRSELETLTQALSRRAFIPGGLQDAEQARAVPTTATLQPYVGWEQMSTQGLITQGSEHYASARAEKALDICILGGSVAQAFAEHGRARLVEILQKDDRLRGREVLVHNYACAGYKQPQQVMLLSYLLALGHKPDLVIELDGFNDTALAWANRASGAHPIYPYFPFWSTVMPSQRPDWEWAEHVHETHVNQERALAFGEWLLRSQLWRSSFLGQIGQVRFERLRGAYVDSYKHLHDYTATRPKDAELRGPGSPANDDVAARVIVRVWEECSLGMKGICGANGIAYLHVLQPTLKDAGSKPLTEKEIAGSGADAAWIEGVERLYAHLRQGGERLSKQGVAFFDATGIFREHPEDLYVDVCHLNQRGNDLMAEAIAKAATDVLIRKN